MKLGKILKSVAPIAASFLPAGGLLSETAKKMLTGKLGIPEGSSDEAIEKAIAEAPPDVIAQIRESDNELEIALGRQRVEEKALGVRRYEARLGDVQDARAMNIETRSKTARNLAYIAVGGAVLFAILIVLVVKEGSHAENLAYAGLGFFSSAALQVLGFYFGNSQQGDEGSQRLQDMVERRFERG